MPISGFRATLSAKSNLSDALKACCLQNPAYSQVKLIIAFASPVVPLDAVVGPLEALHPGAVVIGCSSAGEFTDAGETSGSISLLFLAGDLTVSAGLGVGLRDDVESCIQEACSTLHDVNDSGAHHIALMFADGLAFVGEEAALLAAIHLGPDIALAGASAGDDLRLQQTHVAGAGQVASDAVAIALISSEIPMTIGVAHGHQPLGSWGTVTRSEGNVVYEIDGKPAWQVYRNATAHQAQQQGMADIDFDDPTSFVGYMAAFEAGLQIEKGFKVRAALTKSSDDALNFVCQIPVGTRIDYMGSTEEAQIVSARQAAEMARDRLEGRPAAGVLVFECACRKVILGDRFDEAVEELTKTFPGVPIAGAETYGEIALNAGSLSAYHNSTTVVVAFAKDT